MASPATPRIDRARALVPLAVYQREAIEDHARFRLRRQARQTGKSFQESLDGVSGRHGNDLGSQILRQAEISGQLGGLIDGELNAGFHVRRDPGRVHGIGHAPRPADQLR